MSSNDKDRSGYHHVVREDTALLLTHFSVSEENDIEGPPGSSLLTQTLEEGPLHLCHNGSASVIETMANLAKTCMGTGCLALPFASREGGILLHVLGLLAVALWNVLSVHRLSECWDLLVRERRGRKGTSLIDMSGLSPPPAGTATLGKVAWYAFRGSLGLLILDTMTVILLLGIIVSYIDAIRTFLQGTPFTTNSDVFDAILVAFLIAPLSIVPNLGYLTKTSAAGLFVLGATLGVAAVYGFYSKIDGSHATLNWLPTGGLTGVSQWFGCVVFGFGVVPLTFNFRESMANPAKLSKAALIALLLVAWAYMIIGLGFLILYPNIQSDILSELPTGSIVPTLSRLSMVVVVMATAPLLIVPCGEILEGKLMQPPTSGEDYSHYHHRMKIMVRFGICLLTVVISVGIPEFIGVLTFVGCFCVAFVSFCIPPCLHLLIRLQEGSTSWQYLWVDIVFLAWGLAATGISTILVFRYSIMGTSDS